jgi:hypothetical protein
VQKFRSWLGACGNHKPEGILKELLVQKIVVENARYGRVVALEQLEQPEPGNNLARVVHCLDRTSRYSTVTSRALYKAIEELEQLQTARKAREGCASSRDAEVAPPSPESNERELEAGWEQPWCPRNPAGDQEAGVVLPRQLVRQRC